MPIGKIYKDYGEKNLVMKTEVMMTRYLTEDIAVRQSNKSEMFNVTDLVISFNEDRKAEGLSVKHLTHYWINDSTKEFIEALEMEYDLNTQNSVELKTTRRGKYGGTWVCPEIFVDIAMWLNPRFKAKVMIWVSDNLLGARNSSGIQQVMMNRVVADKFSERTTRWLMVRINQRIKRHILSVDQDWDNATSAQLEERKALQVKIITACELLPDGISEDEFCLRVFKREIKTVA